MSPLGNRYMCIFKLNQEQYLHLCALLLTEQAAGAQSSAWYALRHLCLDISCYPRKPAQ